MSSDDFDYNIVCECGDDFANEELLKVHLKLNNNHIYSENKHEYSDEVVETKKEVSDDEDHSSRHSGYSDSEEDAWKHVNENRYLEIHATPCQDVVNRNDIRCQTRGEQTSSKYGMIKQCLSESDDELSEEARVTVSESTSSTHYSNKLTVKQNAAGYGIKDSSTMHNNVHSDISEYVCAICSKKFANKFGLQRHFRVHTGEKPYICPDCGKFFSQSSSLKGHMKNVHKKENLTPYPRKHRRLTQVVKEEDKPKKIKKKLIKNHSCTTCGKCYVSPAKLRCHLITHTGELPFVCDVCNKGFNQKSTLKTHQRIHTGDRRFSCDLCPKKFYNMFGLTRHRRVHTGEKPYICKECGKAFTQPTNMILHYNTHFGITYPNYKRRAKDKKTMSQLQSRHEDINSTMSPVMTKISVSVHAKEKVKKSQCKHEEIEMMPPVNPKTSLPFQAKGTLRKVIIFKGNVAQALVVRDLSI